MSNLAATGPVGASTVPPARPSTRRRIRGSRADQVYDVFNVVVLSVIALGVLYPLVYIVSSSFSSVKAVLSGHVWLWPVDLSLDGYRAVINYSKT